MKFIVNTWSNITELQPSIFNSGALSYLPQLINLKSINFSNQGCLSDYDSLDSHVDDKYAAILFDSLAKCSSLTQLTLSRYEISGNKLIQMLRGMKELINLTLFDMEITHNSNHD